MANSRLQVHIPHEDLITADSGCQTTSWPSCTITVDSDNYILIDIENVCESGCYAGEPITITIKEGLQNPAIAEYTASSSKLTLTNDDYQIATLSEGITVEPSLQTADLTLTELTMAESSDVAGQPNEIELSF